MTDKDFFNYPIDELARVYTYSCSKCEALVSDSGKDAHIKWHILEKREDYREAEESLRQLISEARGIQKDLRKEMKAARELINSEIIHLIEETVRHQLEEMGTNTKQAMRLSVEKVIREFSKLRDLFLKGDKEDDFTLEELIIGYKVGESINKIGTEINPLRKSP